MIRFRFRLRKVGTLTVTPSPLRPAGRAVWRCRAAGRPSSSGAPLGLSGASSESLAAQRAETRARQSATGPRQCCRRSRLWRRAIFQAGCAAQPCTSKGKEPPLVLREFPCGSSLKPGPFSWPVLPGAMRGAGGAGGAFPAHLGLLNFGGAASASPQVVHATSSRSLVELPAASGLLGRRALRDGGWARRGGRAAQRTPPVRARDLLPPARAWALRDARRAGLGRRGRRPQPTAAGASNGVTRATPARVPAAPTTLCAAPARVARPRF